MGILNTTALVDVLGQPVSGLLRLGPYGADIDFGPIISMPVVDGFLEAADALAIANLPLDRKYCYQFFYGDNPDLLVATSPYDCRFVFDPTEATGDIELNSVAAFVEAAIPREAVVDLSAALDAALAQVDTLTTNLESCETDAATALAEIDALQQMLDACLAENMTLQEAIALLQQEMEDDLTAQQQTLLNSFNTLYGSGPANSTRCNVGSNPDGSVAPGQPGYIEPEPPSAEEVAQTTETATQFKRIVNKKVSACPGRASNKTTVTGGTGGLGSGVAGVVTAPEPTAEESADIASSLTGSSWDRRAVSKIHGHGEETCTPCNPPQPPEDSSSSLDQCQKDALALTLQRIQSRIKVNTTVTNPTGAPQNEQCNPPTVEEPEISCDNTSPCFPDHVSGLVSGTGNGD